MLEPKVGDIVNAQIPDQVLEGYVVSALDSKNDKPVVVLYSGNDSRWAYVENVLEITGQVGPDELASLLDTPRARLGLPETATAQEMVIAFRKQLKVSRSKVAEAAGLSLSVIWRAEQENTTVTEVQLTQIWDALIGIDAAA